MIRNKIIKKINKKMLKYIQRLFNEPKTKHDETKHDDSKHEPITTTTDITELFTGEIVQSTTDKWVPNDALMVKYNGLTREISKLPSLQLKLMELDTYNKRKTQEYDFLSNKEGSKTIYDRLRMTEIKEDLLKNIAESDIIKSKIAKIEQMEDNSILDEYEQYVKNAHTFLVNNNLQNTFTYVDIIDSQSLMIVVKKHLDTLVVCSSEDLQDSALHNLALLDKYFNMKDAIKLRNDKAQRYKIKQEELKKIEMVDIVRESDKIVFSGAGLLLGTGGQSVNLIEDQYQHQHQHEPHESHQLQESALL